MSSSTYVQLVDLAKYFGKVKALDGLSLDIAQGELVALLGPSGCGKTTALRALAGLQELDRGQLMVDGKDVTFQSASKRHKVFMFSLPCGGDLLSIHGRLQLCRIMMVC